MRNWLNPLLFLSGLVTGVALTYVLILLLQRGPKIEMDNMELRMQLLDQENRMLNMQLDLQDSALAEIRALLKDTTTVVSQ